MKYIKGKGVLSEKSHDVGEAIAQFISNVNTVSTRIGDIETQRDGNKLIVIGASVYERASDNGTLLVKTDNGVLPKKDVFNYESRMYLVKYLNSTSDISSEEKAAIKNKYDRIADYRELIVPFKVGSRVKLNIKLDNKGKITVESCIDNFELKIDKKTGEYVGIVIFDYSIENKRVKSQIGLYGDEYKLCDMEIFNAKTDGYEKCIDMTGYGYIKPIEFTNKGTSVIVDCKHIYMAKDGVLNNICTVMEYMERGESAVVEKITDKKLLKAVKANIEYIRRHLRNIAAISMCDTNIIEL